MTRKKTTLYSGSSYYDADEVHLVENFLLREKTSDEVGYADRQVRKRLLANRSVFLYIDGAVWPLVSRITEEGP